MVVIGCVKSCRCLDGDGLETPLLQGFSPRVDLAIGIETGNRLSDKKKGNEDAAERCCKKKEEKVGDVDAEEFQSEDVKIEGEIDTSQDHEDEDDPIGGEAIVAGNAVVAHRKPAG